MTTNTNRHRLYAWAITIAGTAWLLSRLPHFDVSFWLMLALFAAELGAQWVSIPLSGGIRIALDFVVVFFVFLAFGPLPASIAVFVSSIINKIRLKNAWDRVFFIGAQFVIATYGMAAVYNALGGRRGAEVLSLANIPALALAIVVYVALNDLLVGIYHILRGDTTLRDVGALAWAELRIDCILGPFAVFGVYLFSTVGISGIFLMVVLALIFGWPLLLLLRSAVGSEHIGLEAKMAAVSVLFMFVTLIIAAAAAVIVGRMVLAAPDVETQLADGLVSVVLRRLLPPVTIVLLLGFAASALTAQLVYRRILIIPIRNMNAILRGLAESSADLTKRLAHASNDDLGELTRYFNAFASKLENLVRSVVNNANRVATTSEQLAASTQEMSASQQEISSTIQRISQGTATQVASVRDTKDAVEEISASVEQVNTNAKMAALSTSQALQKASEGGTAMESIVGQMADIDGTMTRLSGVVNNLERKAVEVSQITELISSVAWRTNLLALNAAIEAARAGESGRGFSVVAIEVKKLAERTATATGEIDNLIKQIQNEISQTVDTMREGVAKAAKGKELAIESNQAFFQIIDTVKHSAEGVQQISDATARQVESAKKIAKAIDSVAVVAEEIASGMEQTAAAQQQQMASMEEMTASAQELAHAAEEMKNQGGSFVVEEQAK